MLLFDEVDFVQTQNLPVGELLRFMPIGYLLTILIETPILLVGLSKKLSLKQRLLCGVWLTACTYPIVVLVLPAVFQGTERWIYLAAAEIFAPVAECLLFWLAFHRKGILDTADWARCFIAVIAANLASFGLGELIHISGVLGF
jgi:hypothetical protein